MSEQPYVNSWGSKVLLEKHLGGGNEGELLCPHSGLSCRFQDVKVTVIVVSFLHSQSVM